jgi:hypothetical protein
MRDKLIHHYFGVDMGIVRETAPLRPPSFSGNRSRRSSERFLEAGVGELDDDLRDEVNVKRATLFRI